MASTIPDPECAQYHPYDSLIAKHFPDHNLSLLHANKHQLGSLYILALKIDHNRVNHQTRWSEQPHPSVMLGVEEWRRALLYTIDARLQLYSNHTRSMGAPPFGTTRELQPGDLSFSARRVFDIPELLEMILRYATTDSQYAAWNVDVSWRRTIRYILESRYHSHHPCLPVNHGQRIDRELFWLQPTEQEIIDIEHAILSLRQEITPQGPATTTASIPAPSPYFPARISQARNIPQLYYDKIRNCYEHIRHSLPGMLPQFGSPCWLDLSQFNFNPYFLQLFPERVRLHLGRCEIILGPCSSEQRIYKRPLPQTAFDELISSMFLTEPPCKAVGIYLPRRSAPVLRLVAKIRDAGGIRVGQVLRTLEQNADDALTCWKDGVKDLRRNIEGRDWTAFTRWDEKRWATDFEAYPKFTIFLESDEDASTTIAKRFFPRGDETEQMRQEEWYGELDDHGSG